MEVSPSDRAPTPAESALAAWLARRGSQPTSSLDALRREHPEIAAELEQLYERWALLHPVLRLMSLDADNSARLSERIAATHGAGVDPEVELDGRASSAPAGTSELLNRLGAKSPRQSRYRLEGEIARGGMGAILRVWDEDIRRRVAMKVALGHAHAGQEPSPPLEPHQIARFLEEAQITGQLDHPGIVPVHELGLDPDGRVFFTMKLVRGSDLRAVYEQVFGSDERWNETRALGVLLKVCEAVAFAHRKGVIHRDLKPANVMVGDFGEVYVMDWGLARVIGRDDRHDIRLAPEGASSRSVQTERRDEREETPDSPIVTMDGTVVGTPAYMPPEQARGDVEKLDARSDVYAIGAMLYHLLARRMPYVRAGERISNRTVLARVLDQPPDPISSVRADTPPELISICEKAMAREQAHRYPDTLALAEDLRAYLEGRVVRAHAVGAAAELRKWIGRNRGLATATAAAVVLALLGSGGMAWVEAQRNRDLARANQEILGLADMKRLTELRTEADGLWPALPGRIPAMEQWLARAEDLVSRRSRHAEALRRFEATRAAAAAGIAGELEADWLRESMRTLVEGLDAFADPDPAKGTLADVRARLALAGTIAARSISGSDAAKRWNDAIGAIGQSPLYRGLTIRPRVGLLPIGADKESGLWEFAHLLSGEPPERRADGTLAMTEASGLVLVLIPPGEFRMGSETDPAAPAFDPAASPVETPAHDVPLAAFFLSKFEMTQAQWLRIARENPSVYQLDVLTPPRITPLNPVEKVSWEDCNRFLQRLDLTLPTEAQWEYASRGGTTTPWWTGVEKETVDGAGNIADATSSREGPPQWRHQIWMDDGQLVHTQIGRYRANPFGLHDTIGNVAEWCLDSFMLNYLDPVSSGTGERLGSVPSLVRCARGGSFAMPPERVRSADRMNTTPTQRLHDLGVRPAATFD